VSPALKEMSGWMPDAFRVSYGPVAPFALVASGVISILVALQAHSIEVLTLIANNTSCDALEPETRKTEVLRMARKSFMKKLDSVYVPQYS